jgi:hypothetical protein
LNRRCYLPAYRQFQLCEDLEAQLQLFLRRAKRRSGKNEEAAG